MSHLTLKKPASAGVTNIPDCFIDFYMPKASGEYIKVYLYLLRALGKPSIQLSVSGMADALEHTEADIIRALKYWEKQKLLKLECDSSNVLQGIYLMECSAPQEQAEQQGPLISERQSPLLSERQDPLLSERQEPEKPGGRKAYSRSELQKFSEQAECKQLLFVCEQYLKTTLSPSEIETILYFYDGLRFSPDLIEYLVEYCVCKGRKSMHYIESVALAWARADIQTVEQAKERTTTYSKNTFSIMKAFGINDRNPVEPELNYIEKWFGLYDFTSELVLEACKRTMERLHKPSFEYADRILKSWKEQHVRHMEDVKRLDQTHQQKSSLRQPPVSSVRPTKFTNFKQRDYDVDELEKKLLNRQ